MSRRKVSEKQHILAVGVLNGKQASKVCAEAGYSPSISRSPSKILKTKGFQLAMAEEAAKAGYIASAMMASLQAKIMAGELDTINITDTAKTLEKIVNIADKLAEMSGIKAKKDTIDGLENIIDIG